MAKSRGDASDKTGEGAEAQRIKRTLIDPDRALEQRRAADAARQPDQAYKARDRRETVEKLRPVNMPVDHQQAEKARSEVEGQGDYVWVDRGVVDTKLSRIDRKEYAGVWEGQKTHKYSKEEIDASLKSLPEVRLRLGNGTSREELRALVFSSHPQERQIGRTYMSYYESNPIKVEFTAEGKSTVASGRHRLDRAGHHGMDEIPMRVSEQIRRKIEEEH
jgi:hypothetical protein